MYSREGATNMNFLETFNLWHGRCPHRMTKSYTFNQGFLFIPVARGGD